MDKRELPIEIDVMQLEYVPFCQDLMRVVCIQIVVQFMMMLRGSTGFDAEFLELVLYILAGVSMYWLVLRKVVVFSAASKTQSRK